MMTTGDPPVIIPLPPLLSVCLVALEITFVLSGALVPPSDGQVGVCDVRLCAPEPGAAGQGHVHRLLLQPGGQGRVHVGTGARGR